MTERGTAQSPVAFASAHGKPRITTAALAWSSAYSADASELQVIELGIDGIRE